MMLMTGTLASIGESTYNKGKSMFHWNIWPASHPH